MRFGKVIVLSCVAAGMATGCVSIGNSGVEALGEKERAELRQEMAELQGELGEVSAELQDVLEEAKAEVREELGADAGWIREMICKDGKRPRRVLWKKGQEEAEIGNREEFTESLALADWKASAESTEGLTEDAVYTVQWKKSVGLFDGWKNEYVDIGTLTVYQDSNLVTARICAMDGIFGKASDLFGGGAGDMDEWFAVVYEIPQDAAERLRGESGQTEKN